MISLSQQYKLGNPLDNSKNLGPMVKASAANFVRKQIAQAGRHSFLLFNILGGRLQPPHFPLLVEKGAVPLIDTSLFPEDRVGTPYMAPQVLVNVNHTMDVMMDESFGPVIGIMKVSTDEEAVTLMNDSPFGLTASIWTNDTDAAIRIGDQ